jgi:hypothetical protein
MKFRTLILLAPMFVSALLGCSQEPSMIRSCDRRDWPIASAFDIEKWKSDPNERIAFVAWVETNLKGVAIRDVVTLLGEPERRGSVDNASEIVFYSLGEGNFFYCREPWLRELRLVVDKKLGVTSVTYEQRAP